MYKKLLFLSGYFLLFSLNNLINAAQNEPVAFTREQKKLQNEFKNLYENVLTRLKYDLITENPQKALETAASVGASFLQATEILLGRVLDYPNSFEAGQKALQQLEKDHKQKHPYFLLSECGYDEPKNTCALKRSFQPQFRAAFESEILQAMSRLKKSDTQLSYVSCGFGNGFQDTRILALLLKQIPSCKELNVSCIDNEFTPLDGIKQYFGPYKFSEKTPLDAPFLLSNNKKALDPFITINKSSFQEWQNLSDEAVLHNAALRLFLTKQRYKQVKTALAVLAPTVKVTVFLHSCVESYEKSLTDNPALPPADCVVTADTNDHVSVTCLNALPDWMNLCKLALGKNSKTFCLALKTDTSTESNHNALIEESLLCKKDDGRTTFKVMQTVIPFEK